MIPAYVLTATAETELQDIIAYTYDRWGEDQARAYANTLLGSMTALAAGHERYRDLADLHPGLRTAKSGRHHIFCLVRVDAPALVIAILHERMDLMMRLNERLT
ncbi:MULTISPECIES: type II toxin-antitoxin system RelE/ParE family toxin [Sphingobium]|uniref:type II toxin-antitoxin system RelE/ParE family toxin n=1 Tax=Sphingobium TaxID=165695 RepID=UPI0018D4DF5D|nr:MULTISPECIES: type II toxin-antitoxin system RelE/ParE family toxin [Sphingobium]